MQRSSQVITSTFINWQERHVANYYANPNTSEVPFLPIVTVSLERVHKEPALCYKLYKPT